MHVLAVALEIVRPYWLALDVMLVTVGDGFLDSGKDVAVVEGDSAVAVEFYGNPTRPAEVGVLGEGEGE